MDSGALCREGLFVWACSSEAEKPTGQRRDEEGLLQRVRNPHTPAHEIWRAVALLFQEGVHRGRLGMYTSAISALGRVHACEDAVAHLEMLADCKCCNLLIRL